MRYKSEVVDCRLKDNLNQLVFDAVKDADIIGIATYCDSFVFLQEITRLLKKECPGKPIFLGGPLVTSLPEIILNNTSTDWAILGEGELTLIELFNRYFVKKSSDFSDIKGIAYKKMVR